MIWILVSMMITLWILKKCICYTTCTLVRSRKSLNPLRKIIAYGEHILRSIFCNWTERSNEINTNMVERVFDRNRVKLRCSGCYFSVCALTHITRGYLKMKTTNLEHVLLLYSRRCRRMSLVQVYLYMIANVST